MRTTSTFNAHITSLTQVRDRGRPKPQNLWITEFAEQIPWISAIAAL
jgi:hypothetical protein